MKKGGHIVLAGLLLLLCVGGCGRRGRVIPVKTFAEIYADMFVADQWLTDNYNRRRTADTTDFYGPVFEKYGYSFKDYDRSVKHYLRNPENYSRLVDKTVEILDKRIGRLKEDNKRWEEFQAQMDYLRANALGLMDFEADTLLWRPDTTVLDSLALDSLALDSLALDSLARRDSLALADSLARANSLARADSLVHADFPAREDSIAVIVDKDKKPDVKGRHRIRPDSLKATRKLLRDKPVAK